MARIFKLDIKNFRGIKEFSHTFDDLNLICLVGRGDSGKSSVLSAILYVLFPNWNLSFYDTDFYNCDIEHPIEIEATLVEVPDELLREDKYGLYIRGIDKKTNAIKDELEDEYEKALTIRLKVEKDLEPKWHIINSRQDSLTEISAYDRAKLNAFMVSDYLDGHFYWNKGSPLFSLLKQGKNVDISEKDTILIDTIRKAKDTIDSYSFEQFQKVIDILKSKTEEFGIKLSDVSNSFDFKDIFIKDGKISLHDGKIPLRLKGKGSKRLVSIASQMALAESGGIILIDEIEQGLEPDRVKHLARTLYKDNKGQTFITTHSQGIIEELEVENILILNNDNGMVQCKKSDKKFQGVIRACPEAVYAKKVIVCEGKTEIGICRALDDFRITKGKTNLTALDVVYTGGGGNNLSERALELKRLELDICVLCDSDEENLNDKKKEMRDEGIKIFDWDENNSIEQQVFSDLPWNAVKKLIAYQESKSSEESVKNCIESKIERKLGNDWKENDDLEIRKVLGEVARDKAWFKRIDHGEFLGSVIFKHFDKIKDKTLGKRLQELSGWIDNE
jgi:predicted ATP-dependent endonuclease of OLD family